MTVLKWLAAIAIAFVVGKLISKLRLPAILGWLITGIAVGPYAFGLISQELVDASWYETLIQVLECVVGIMIGTELVFGKINYWTMCKQLKKVMAECGIEKQISYHCARHTFGTLALSKGMPIESVSRVLGHTNIVTTQIYAKITTQKLDNDLTTFGNKLNASFGSVTP